MSVPSLSLKSQVSSLKFKDALSASSKPNFRLQTSNLRLRKSKGLSLVELVVFIVIVSAAVAGIIGVIDVTTRSSADPMIHKQALAIAEAVMEEVRLMPFTHCDPDDAGAATADAAGAPIAFDAASQGTTGSTAVGSLTFPHAVGAAGTRRILVVGVNLFSTADPLPTVSSMTYAGQSMIFLAAKNDDVAPNTRIRSEMWYITAPASGANNIAITFSANVRAVAGGMSYTGVHQTTPLGTAATAGASSGTTATVTVSSAAGELVVDTVGARENTSENQSLTKGAGQTQRYNGVSRTGTGSNSNVVGAGSEEAGAASVTMSWTVGTSARWAIVAAPLKPAGGCATLTEAIGPEAGETRYGSTLAFDNVNDYHGFDSNTAVPSGIRYIDSTLIDGLDGYRVTVSVAGQPLGAIGNDAYGTPQSLLVTVTVTGPGNTTVTLNGYRTRYAPNDLP